MIEVINMPTKLLIEANYMYDIIHSVNGSEIQTKRFNIYIYSYIYTM